MTDENERRAADEKRAACDEIFAALDRLPGLYDPRDLPGGIAAIKEMLTKLLEK